MSSIQAVTDTAYFQAGLLVLILAVANLGGQTTSNSPFCH
jgi:hypothetical protein